MKGIWSKCKLALYCWWRWFALITLDSSTRHTPFNLSWASNSNHVSNHSEDREERRRQFRKHQNQANNSCNIKQFLTVPKLCEFGLIRKFRSRALICNKNQLNQSYKTQVMIKRSLNINLNKIRNLKISKSWCDRFTE